MKLLHVFVISLGLASVSVAQPPYQFQSQITATITDTYVKPLADGNTLTNTVSGNLYRDQNGRMRIERGANVWIQDPVAGFSAVLDTGAKTATVLVTPGRTAVASAPAANAAAGAPGSTASRSPTVDLGTQVLSGFPAAGSQFTSTIPIGAIGNILPIVTTTEVWISKDLHLPLLVTVSNSLNGQHTTAYSNIQETSQLAASLFAIPAGYQTTSSNVNLNAQLPQSWHQQLGK
jgi:hypothetical protein